MIRALPILSYANGAKQGFSSSARPMARMQVLYGRLTAASTNTHNVHPELGEP